MNNESSESENTEIETHDIWQSEAMEQFERERDIQIPKFYSYTSKNIFI